MALNCPETIEDTAQLEDLLSEPTPEAIAAMGALEGGLVILGAAGKMGPTLVRMALRAGLAAGVSRHVVAVSRFRDGAQREMLERCGVETIACDLLDEDAVADLPGAANVVYMAGMKFGSTGNEPLTWAMNCHAPALAARRYHNSRIVAFSTGNVYGCVPCESGGSREEDPPRPEGEYAMSCLGRERVFDYFCRRHGSPAALLRLNYACETRYGVLVDIGLKVWRGEPVDVTMGYVNVIWQGDANAMALCAFRHADVPARVINIAGPDMLRVRDVANAFGRLMKKEPVIVGEEAPGALLNDGRRGHALLGAPRISADRLIIWTADWIMRGGDSLNKPTHFEVRDGRY
jgi:nucleoside-diphosphate-sugar epimerase